MRVMTMPADLARLAGALSERHAFAEQGCVLINTDEPATAHEPALRCLAGRDLPTAVVARTDAAALGVRVPEKQGKTGQKNPHDTSELWHLVSRKSGYNRGKGFNVALGMWPWTGVEPSSE